MGRPRKQSIIQGNVMQYSKKIKGDKWTQPEMETLASLCVSHGRSGILSKETNKATTAKKDMQWITVQSLFNSMHPPRDKSALLARFKYILMHLRKEKARERRNNVTTGGGPSALNEEKMPFEVTGPMLELANLLGVSISGLDGFGSDLPFLLTEKTSTKSLNEPNDETQAVDGTHDLQYSFEHTMKDHWENLVNDGIGIENNQSVSETEKAPAKDPQPHIESPGTETEAIHSDNVDLIATSVPSRMQFFPTSFQRRPTKRKASSAILRDLSAEGTTTDMLEMRKEYLAERDRREREKHAAEMSFERAIMEAKLEEMRQIASDRQAERERRTELHAMVLRHKEAIFNHQKEVMIAARNALACSSRDAALGSVISLTMENTGCLSVDETIMASTFVANHLKSET